MAETKRYRLRADIPGEMFGEDHGGMIWLRYQMPDGEHTLVMAADLLEEVPPPIPPEPEPGAYLIGDRICERYEQDHPERWQAMGTGIWTWDKLWDMYGGPDVRIVPLVPKAVELPWTYTDVDGDRVTVDFDHTSPYVQAVARSGADRVLVRVDGRAMAAALLTAADRAETDHA